MNNSSSRSENRIFAPNYTQIPNIIFDFWMNILTPAQFKVLLCICRKTFGWRKDTDKISISQIEKMTGLSRQGIVKSTEELIEHGIVIKIKSKDEIDGSDAPNRYEINVIENSGGSQLSLPPLVNSVDSQKKDLTKEINTKERIGLSPSHVSSISSSVDEKDPPNITVIISETSKKIKFGEYVEYTQSEYDQLIKDFSKQEVDTAISEIEDWYPDRDKKKCKWQSGFYRGTRRWIRTMRDKAKQSRFYSKNVVQTQEDLFKEINTRRDKAFEFFSKFKIHLQQKSIRFIVLDKAVEINNDLIDFRDNKFIELMNHALDKNGWNKTSKQNLAIQIGESKNIAEKEFQKIKEQL